MSGVNFYFFLCVFTESEAAALSNGNGVYVLVVLKCECTDLHCSPACFNLCCLIFVSLK